MLVGGSLSGCGDGAPVQSGSAAASVSEATGIITRPSSAQAPQISGSASPTATAGQSYVFQPQASGSSGATLSFTIANKPTWAIFSSTTGKLSGSNKLPNDFLKSFGWLESHQEDILQGG